MGPIRHSPAAERAAWLAFDGRRGIYDPGIRGESEDARDWDPHGVARSAAKSWCWDAADDCADRPHRSGLSRCTSVEPNPRKRLGTARRAGSCDVRFRSAATRRSCHARQLSAVAQGAACRSRASFALRIASQTCTAESPAPVWPELPRPAERPRRRLPVEVRPPAGAGGSRFRLRPDTLQIQPASPATPGSEPR